MRKKRMAMMKMAGVSNVVIMAVGQRRGVTAGAGVRRASGIKREEENQWLGV